MAENLDTAVPKVLKALWDMENDLRSAAQKGVFLKKEEAREHLAGARRHLDELLGIVKGQKASDQVTQPPRSAPNTDP